MKPRIDSHLIAIDRALLALMQERAVLLADQPTTISSVEDNLARSSGPLSADVVRAVFRALDDGVQS